MDLRDDLADRMVEVVLRFPDENGIVDATGRHTLETEKGLIFGRDADGGIGELKHRFAFVTSVVPLGAGTYRIEDMWYGHPFRMLGEEGEEKTAGGLAFRDVFLARPLADGSLLFDRVVQRGGWRLDYWMLPSPSFVHPRYLNEVVANVEAHGGCVEQDPWIGNWLWTFLPPETDYDPTSDIEEALRRIPRAAIEEAQKEFQERFQRSEEDPN